MLRKRMRKQPKNGIINDYFYFNLDIVLIHFLRLTFKINLTYFYNHT